MTLQDFIERVIKDGIEAAKKNYPLPHHKDKREGSVAGFNACLDKDPVELYELLQAARTATHDARVRKDRYWWYRCYELEVEWVCNCVSAVLYNERKPVLMNPSGRALTKAVEILGLG